MLLRHTARRIAWRIVAALSVTVGVMLSVACDGAAPPRPRVDVTAGALAPPPAVDAPATRVTDPRTGDHVVTRQRASMGTRVVLTAWGEDDARIARAFDDAFAEFERIDRLMTTWTDASEVSRINAAAGSGLGVRVSSELLDVLDKALWAAKISGGAFDATVGAFAGVWKFDEDRDGTIPPPALVEERRRLVGFADLIVDRARGEARLVRPGQRITLGGIAKGHAVDRATAILRSAGLVDFLVQAGGDLYVAGQRGARPWRIGIRDPRGAPDDYFALADITDRSFSTSGDYERFVIVDGRRYHHILDPATGYPAMRTRSVTVLAKDALTADALSKGLFVLGPERGLALVESVPDADAVFVGADGKVTVSRGLTGRLTLLHPPRD